MTQIGTLAVPCDICYLTLLNRWVYRRFFVADGNFKADHVQQQKNADVWLSEGGGMFPKRAEYRGFLEEAVNHLTVCIASNLDSC
jgi:hypothetical protein